MIALFLALALAADPQIPNPSLVVGLVSATSFTLQESYRSDWSAERPEVRGGTVLVLDIEPDALRLRNGPSPVLFVGTAPAEVIGRDVAAGRLTVVVPGVMPSEAYVYFAGNELPERVTAELGARALDAAKQAGVQPIRVPTSAAPLSLKGQRELMELGGRR